MLALVVLLTQFPAICIDPGHPSESGRGAIGKHTTEIKVAWRIANLVATKLRTDGYAVVLTKSNEQQFVTNRRRAEIANNAHAALLLRLHCDASSASGFGVYYPDRAGQAPDGHRGPSKEVLTRSATSAKIFHAEVAKRLAGKLHDRGLMSDMKTAIGGRQGALTGSIYSKVPTVLIEMVVLTNRHDEAFVTSKIGERELSNAIAAAAEAAVPHIGRGHRVASFSNEPRSDSYGAAIARRCGRPGSPIVRRTAYRSPGAVAEARFP
ncbi:MAG: N-acetylmuramoyl-L-alanine amidase family protein [Fimbriimonadaceae bacterium]